MNNPGLRAKMVFKYVIGAAFLACALFICVQIVSIGITGQGLFDRESTVVTRRGAGNPIVLGALIWLLQYVGFAALRGGRAARLEANESPAEFRAGALWERRGTDPVVAPTRASVRDPADGQGAPRQPAHLDSTPAIVKIAHVIGLTSVVLAVVGIPFTDGYSMWALTIGLPISFFFLILGVVVSHLDS